MADKNSKELSEIDPFIIIDDESGERFYGGHQAWFPRKTMSYAGCGVVAAANTLRALLCKHPELYEGLTGRLKLLGGVILTKAEYLSVISEMYKSMLIAEVPVINMLYDIKDPEYGSRFLKVIPPSFGMSAAGVVTGVLSYARKHGLLLHCEHMPAAYADYMKGLDFIKRGLSENGAVIILTSFNRHPLSFYRGKPGETGSPSYEGSMKTHFATITDILYKEGHPVLKLSTWGKAATVEYDRLFETWQKRRAFVSSLIYFTPESSLKTWRSDFRRVLPFTVKAAVQSVAGRRLMK